MNSQKVSIIIPTKNRCRYLTKAIQSVLGQTYCNWQLVVVDDGSNDGTSEFMQELALHEDRVIYIQRQGEMSGAPRCRNLGLRNACGEYIIFLDSDDVLDEKCLEGRVKHLKEDINLDFVTANASIFENEPGDTEKYWSTFDERNDLDRFIACDVPWQTSGPMFRAQFLQHVGHWDEQALSWQDWEFHIRCLILCRKYVKLNNADYYYRQSTNQSISSDTSSNIWVNRIFLAGRIKIYLANANALSPSRLYNLRCFVLNGIFSYIQRCEPINAIRSAAAARKNGLIGLPEYALHTSVAILQLMPTRIAKRCIRKMHRILCKIPQRDQPVLA